METAHCKEACNLRRTNALTASPLRRKEFEKMNLVDR
jgi:hypothetical protein